MDISPLNLLAWWSRWLLAIAALIGANACGAAGFGAVRIDASGAAYVLSLQQLAPNDLVFFQVPDARGRPRCCVRRPAASFAVAEADAAASDALGDRPVLRYRLTHPWRGTVSQPFLGIATIVRGGAVTQRANGSVRIAGDRFTGRACTSEEGFHVLGEDVHGRVASDLYVGLGYSVEAKTCLPAVGASASAPAQSGASR